jgi:serine/threonine protein kinase
MGFQAIAARFALIAGNRGCSVGRAQDPKAGMQRAVFVSISSEATVAKVRASAVADPQPRSQAQSDPREGTVLKGKYRLERKIGEGGMGVVFRAVDLEADKFNRDCSVVAIKLLKPEVQAGPGAMAALFEEVEQTRKLQQENIVDVYAFEQDDENAFMVMEFLNGRPLDRLISDEYALGMPFALSWPIINGMGQALAFAHKRGIIHSDFKPSNVFVTAVGAKVLDFGIARAARSTDLSRPGDAIKGLTVAYASCDMLCLMPPDARDDVFAFGLVVYQLLSGRHPFDKLPATVARDKKMEVAAIRGLTHRQNTALAAALRFERFVRTPNIQEVLDELWEGAKGPGRTGLWVAVCALLIVIAGFGARSAYQWFGPQDSDQVFLERLTTSGAPPAPGGDRETINNLLDQGHAYLNDGLKPFDPGLLSEDVSSALGAFQAVLMFDPSNSAAARGILAVVTAYKAEAQRLYAAGKYQRAEDLTKIALRIWPDSVDLDKLNGKIRYRLTQESVKPRP